jgi:hypothetical protein
VAQGVVPEFKPQYHREKKRQGVPGKACVSPTHTSKLQALQELLLDEYESVDAMEISGVFPQKQCFHLKNRARLGT